MSAQTWNLISLVLLLSSWCFEVTDGWNGHTPYRGRGFIFVDSNGHLSSHGVPISGPPTTLGIDDIVESVSTKGGAYAALLTTGNVVVWGNNLEGGNFNTSPPFLP